MPITVAQAKELTGRIKRSAEDVCRLLEEAHERKAWQPLGYKSWKAYVDSEFDMSKQRAYQLLNYATVRKALEVTTGSTTVDLSERQARRIKPELPGRG